MWTKIFAEFNENVNCEENDNLKIFVWKIVFRKG